MADWTPPDFCEPPDIKYADCIAVAFSEFRFKIIFGQAGAIPRPDRMHTGIIASPDAVEAFRAQLEASLEQYARVYGPVRRS